MYYNFSLFTATLLIMFSISDNEYLDLAIVFMQQQHWELTVMATVAVLSMERLKS